MVLSTTNKAASVASITNQDQGGGPKKAGLPKQVGREAYTSIVMTGRTKTIRKPLVMVE